MTKKIFDISDDFYKFEEVIKKKKVINPKIAGYFTSDFGWCCGAVAIPANKAEQAIDERNLVGIQVYPCVVGKEKKRGSRRIYHVETSNGPVTVDLVTRMNEKDREDADDAW